MSARTFLILVCPLVFGCTNNSAGRPERADSRQTPDSKDSGLSIVVYTALDREFSEPIFDDFTSETGIKIRAKYDTEANKSVALANLIIAEKERPRCNVLWNNEIIHTLRLQKEGLLAVYKSEQRDSYDPQFYDSNGHWHGFAARARVLLVNKKLVAKQDFPNSIYDLADPKWKGRAAIAKPLFGTTASHATCLFTTLGEDNASQLFSQIKANARVFAGNKQVAQAVASGVVDFGLTDTDDAMIEIENGHPVEIVYPDQETNQMGTLFIPNTLAIIKGSSSGNEQAKRLVDFLLSAKTEAKLAAGRSAQIPLNSQSIAKVRVQTPRTIRPMKVNFNDAASAWKQVSKHLRKQFMVAK